MECAIRFDPNDVHRRLKALGLTFEECMRVVNAMVAAFNGCTDNDPPTAAGWDAWRFGTRTFRDVKRSHGWEKDDQDNLSTIVHPDRAFRIAVVNTNEATGVREAQPKNKSAKGSGSERAVRLNREPPLPIPEFLKEYEEALAAAARSDAPIWYLCAYISNDAVRAELSFPMTVEGGYLCNWRERIILIDQNGPVCDVRGRDDDDYGPDFDIPVRRKR